MFYHVVLGYVLLWLGTVWQAWLAKMRFVEVGKSWCVRVRFVLARQASLGELGYVLYCGEVSRGISR